MFVLEGVSVLHIIHCTFYFAWKNILDRIPEPFAYFSGFTACTLVVRTCAKSAF